MTVVGTHFGSAVLLAIVPILDLVIASSTECSGDLSPFWAFLGIVPLDVDTLLWGDGTSIDTRLQILVIALSALFSVSGAMFLRNVHPRLRPMDSDKVQESRVLHLGPGTFLDACHHSCSVKQGHVAEIAAVIDGRAGLS